MDKLVIKKVRVDLTNESSVLDDTAQQVPETCSSVSQSHRPYRRILCRFSRLIRLLGSLSVMAPTVVKNRNKRLTKVCCVHINRLALPIRLRTPGNWQKVDSLVDSLSRVLQAVTGQSAVQWMRFSYLEWLICKRCAVTNAKIWDEVLAKITEYNLNEIKLDPRHMRPPSRFEQQPKAFESHRFYSPEEFYRVHYFSFIDAVISNIYWQIRSAWCEVVCWDGNSCHWCLQLTGHNEPVGWSLLQVRWLRQIATYLATAHAAWPLSIGNYTVSEAAAQFRTKSHEVRALFDEVERLFKFLLVIPASSATAERSFSSLRQLKTYLSWGRQCLKKDWIRCTSSRPPEHARQFRFGKNQVCLFLQMIIDRARLAGRKNLAKQSTQLVDWCGKWSSLLCAIGLSLVLDY